MGTRSRTEIFDSGVCIASIYRQFDGYPSGQGADIAKITAKLMVNGISGDDMTVFNGMGCFAAQLITVMKEGKAEAGGIYLKTPMTEDGECGEEFVYRVHGNSMKPEAGVRIEVSGGDITAFGDPNDPASFRGLFSGNASEFAAWIEKDGEDAD